MRVRLVATLTALALLPSVGAQAQGAAPNPCKPIADMQSMLLSQFGETPFTQGILARFALLNVAVLAAFGMAWRSDLAQPFVENPVSAAILSLYVVGLILTAVRAWKVSAGLNDVKSRQSEQRRAFERAVGQVGDHRALRALEVRLSARLTVVSFICGLLVMLGLLGTAYGMFGAMQAVDFTVVGTSDFLGVIATAAQEGFRPAMISTVAGVATAMALSINDQMLNTATAKLYAAILDGG